MRTLAGWELLPWKPDWKFLEHSSPFSAASVDGSRALSQADCGRHFNGKDWILYFLLRNKLLPPLPPWVLRLFFSVMKRGRKWGLLPNLRGDHSFSFA